MIEHFFNEANGNENEYTLCQNIRLVGENLRFDKADPVQGVFLTPASGPEVRATVYGTNDPTIVQAFVPTGLTGAQTVRIAAFINGSVRTYTYTDQITPSA